MARSKRQSASALSQKMAWAYSHPLRARALMILGARVASPKEIAEEVDAPLGRVSYHIRQLCEKGLIELVETDGSRGGVQHFYRASRLPIIDRKAMRVQDEAQRAVGSSVVINLMVSDVAAAVEHGLLDRRPERVLVRYHARVDAQGWDQLSELYTNAMYRSIEIHKESLERLRQSGGEEIKAAMHTLVFEMPTTEEVPPEETMESTLEWVDGAEESPLQDGG